MQPWNFVMWLYRTFEASREVEGGKERGGVRGEGRNNSFSFLLMISNQCSGTFSLIESGPPPPPRLSLPPSFPRQQILPPACSAATKEKFSAVFFYEETFRCLLPPQQPALSSSLCRYISWVLKYLNLFVTDLTSLLIRLSFLLSNFLMKTSWRASYLFVCFISKFAHVPACQISQSQCSMHNNYKYNQVIHHTNTYIANISLFI